MKGRVTWLVVSGTTGGSVAIRSKDGIALVVRATTAKSIILKD